MSKISFNLNHFLRNLVQLNHFELYKHLDCCLDPLPGLVGTRDETTAVPSLTKAAPDRLAAILVPLLRVQCDWHILLTKRAAHLTHHAGQISFPGGAVESSDASPVAAALREAFEEVHLVPGRVRVAGLLNKVRSPAGFLVQPVVGIVCDENALDSLVPDPAEVDLIFTLPLMHLVNPENFRLVPRKTNGRRNDYWVMEHDDHFIWGLSARVLNDLHRRICRAV